MVAFRKAVKRESKLRLALAGPAGSGKTYTALTLAAALASGKPVAVIDTERGSASKYADLFEFDVCELESFHPVNYVQAIRDAVAAGYAVVVIDSLSHAWNGTDGLLELVEKIAKRERVNTFQAWGLVKPIENQLVEAITGSNIHVIATMRSKSEYVVEQVERNGRTVSAPRKVGMAPVQRDGFEYEFDVFGEMETDNSLIVQKTRCPALAGAVIAKPGKPLAETLRAWLSGAPAPVASMEERKAPIPLRAQAAPAASMEERHIEESPVEKIRQRMAEQQAWDEAHKPAPAAKDEPPARKMGRRLQGLQTRMRKIGVTGMRAADALTQAACGKTWAQCTDLDADAIETEVKRREDEASELDITFTDHEPEPPASLEGLDFGERGK